MVSDDRLLLPFFQPPVARDLAVVIIGVTIAFFPSIELAGRKLCPLSSCPWGSSVRSGQYVM